MTDESKMKEIYAAFWEDYKANITFFYTGKNEVLGLTHPEYVYKNDDKYKFARVAFYELQDTGDDVIITYIKESLSVFTIASTTSDLHADKMKSAQIHVEAMANNGRIIPNSAKCTLTNLNIEDEDPNIIVTEDSFERDGSTKYGLGVWVECTEMLYVLTAVQSSIGTDSIPMDNDYYPSTYTAHYLTTEDKENDVNVCNIEDFLSARQMTEPVKADHFLAKKVEEIYEKVKYEPHQFIQNTVQYNPNYTPVAAREEELIQGTTIRGPVLDRIIALDPIDKSFHVLKNGIYALQLKNGLYLVQGESRVDLNVYIDDNNIKEMNMSNYIKSNPSGLDDAGKVLKNTYSSQVYITPLKVTDKIKLTATWMDITDIQVENECMMSVTALQYNTATI